MISEVTFEKTTYADLPHKFEAGTPNVCGVIAFGVALDFMNGIGFDRIAAYEQELLEYVHGCHEDPTALERRLEEDAELRVLVAEAQDAAGLLRRAARESVPALDLTPPPAAEERAPRRIAPCRRTRGAGSRPPRNAWPDR